MAEPHNQPAASAAPRRNIVLSKSAMEDALQLAHQGKVSVKNAWEIKVLEGMHDAVSTVLDNNNTGDQYHQFTHAANVVEGGAKVWTHRVESIYLLSIQTLQRMLRNNTRDEDEKGEGEEGESGGQTTTVRRKKKMLERTVAESTEEIDMDSKEEAARGTEAVSAMFRAMTEKFDQSHASGLLLNNAPYGAAGNVILDRNDAILEGDTPGAALGTPGGGATRDRHTDEIEEEEVIVGRTPDGRLSQLAFSPKSHVPYARPSQHEVDEGTSPNFEGGESSRAASVYNKVDQELFSARPSRQSVAGPSAVNDDDYDDEGAADFGGDDYNVDDEELELPDDPAARSRLGSIAKGLVSGRAELEELDRLALEVENPRDWVPLSQVAGSAADRRSHILSTIRRQCVAPKAIAQQTQQGDGAEKTSKKRRLVSFAPTTAGTAEQLKMNRTAQTALTPLGKLWNRSESTINPTDYADPTKCEAISQEHHLHQSSAFAGFKKGHNRHYTSLDGRDIREDMAVGLLSTLDNPLAASTGSAVWGNESINTKTFFQPFCTKKDHWSVLNKTLRHMQLASAAEAVGNVSRFNHEDYEHHGEDGVGVVGQLPFDVFEGDGGDMGYDDGPDDHDDDAPLFDLPTAEAEPLPLGILVADGTEEGPKLIEGPDMVKRTLKLNRATVPTMVDVVRLRRQMWNSAEQIQQEMERANPRQSTGASRKRGRHDDDEDSPDRVPIDENQPNTFCNIVTKTLPHVQSFSRDGSLSPAFFFFSALFLSNEHGLKLKSSDSVLDDIEFVKVERNSAQ